MSDLTPIFGMSDLTPIFAIFDFPFCASDFCVRYATCGSVLCFHHDY